MPRQRKHAARAAKPSPPTGAEGLDAAGAPLPMAEPRLYTLKEAMQFLRVSRSTIYRLMSSGQLKGHKVGSTWRFYRDDVLAAIETPVAEGAHARSPKRAGIAC